MTRAIRRNYPPFLFAALLLGALYWAGRPQRAMGVVDYYASPSGSGSACTIGTPCAIDTLLFAGGAGLNSSGQCANLWLRGGTYSTGTHQKLFQGIDPGSASCHATVRSFPGEQATIDCSMDKSTVAFSNSCFNMYQGAHHVWFQNIDWNNTIANNRWTTDGTDPQFRTEAITMFCDGCKIINSTIRNTSQGMLKTSDILSDGIEVYGSLVYYNGFDSPDRGHGHGLYWQTAPSVVQARAVARADVLFNQFGFNFHFYNTGAADNYLTIDQGVAFDAGLLTQIGQPGKCNFLLGSEGGQSGPDCNSNKAPVDPTITNSISYFSGGGGKGFDIGDSKGCKGTITFTGNYSVTGSPGSDIGWQLGTPCGVVNSQNNTIIGQLNGSGASLNMPCNGVPPNPLSTVFNVSGNTCVSAAPGTNPAIVYVPNAYESGRGMATVYNPQGLSSVTLDLAAMGGFNGEKWKIVSVQDFYLTGANAAHQSTGAPVASGTCGSPCTTTSVFTSGLTVEQPTGNRGNPGHIGETITVNETGPTFNVYILLVDVGGANTPTPTNTLTSTNTPTRTFTLTNTPTASIPTNTPTATLTNAPANTNTFTPSLTPTVTPTPSISSTTFEFESCALTAPMAASADPTASGGFYVSSGTTDSGVVTCTFTAPATGSYYPWVRKWTDATNADSMYVSLNGASDTTQIFDMSESLICATCTVEKILQDANSGYRWIRLNNRASSLSNGSIGCASCASGVGQPWIWSLTSGTNTVAFRNREASAGDSGRLDIMIVSNDPAFDPNQQVGGPTPTPTPGVGNKHMHRCNGKIGWHSHPNSGPHRHVPCPWK